MRDNLGANVKLMATKKARRTAWGLAAILALVLLVGTGVMLTHGVALGLVTVQVLPTWHWTTGDANAAIETESLTTHVFFHGLYVVVITTHRKR